MTPHSNESPPRREVHRSRGEEKKKKKKRRRSKGYMRVTIHSVGEINSRAWRSTRRFGETGVTCQWSALSIGRIVTRHRYHYRYPRRQAHRYPRLPPRRIAAPEVGEEIAVDDADDAYAPPIVRTQNITSSSPYVRKMLQLLSVQPKAPLFRESWSTHARVPVCARVCTLACIAPFTVVFAIIIGTVHHESDREEITGKRMRRWCKYRIAVVALFVRNLVNLAYW